MGLGAHLGAAGNAPDPACWWIGDGDARSFALAHIGRNQPRAFAYPLSVCPCSRHTRRWSSQNCWRSVRRAFERGIACTIADTLRGILDGAPWHGRQPYGITHSTRRTTFPSFSMISVRTVARISPVDQRATRPPPPSRTTPPASHGAGHRHRRHAVRRAHLSSHGRMGSRPLPTRSRALPLPPPPPPL